MPRDARGLGFDRDHGSLPLRYFSRKNSSDGVPIGRRADPWRSCAPLEMRGILRHRNRDRLERGGGSGPRNSPGRAAVFSNSSLSRPDAEARNDDVGGGVAIRKSTRGITAKVPTTHAVGYNPARFAIIGGLSIVCPAGNGLTSKPAKCVEAGWSWHFR